LGESIADVNGIVFQVGFNNIDSYHLFENTWWLLFTANLAKSTTRIWISGKFLSL